MAKGFSLNFDGFLALAEEISSIGDEYLLKATEGALYQSKMVVNEEIGKALKDSKFNFTDGVGYSQGKTRESLSEIWHEDIVTEYTTVTAYAGVNLQDAPEALILALYGSPHQAKDTKLAHAIQVKGKVRKRVNSVQSKIFNDILEEALSNG